MKIKFSYLLCVIAVSAVVSSCSCGSGGGPQPETTKVKPFPSVVAPEMISSPQERVDYLAEHFWDLFASPSFTGVCDSNTVKGVALDEFSKNFVTWAVALKQSSPKAVKKAVETMFDKAVEDAGRDSTSNFFEKALELAEKYLYDPNSPTRNEEAYLFFLNRLISSPLVDPDLLPSYTFAAGICSLNRPGTKASDFSFITREGREKTLYSIDAPTILLFFSNPGCPLCAGYQESLEGNPFLQEKIEAKELVVVNIYPDEDVQAWEGYVAHYPTSWVCGRDHLGRIRANLIYGLRAIPSLYILDEDKTVIAKDVSYEEAEMILENLLYHEN